MGLGYFIIFVTIFGGGSIGGRTAESGLENVEHSETEAAGSSSASAGDALRLCCDLFDCNDLEGRLLSLLRAARENCQGSAQ